MAHQQHANGVTSTSPQIDAVPTVNGPTPEDHQSEKDAQDTSGADAAPNSVLPDMSAPQIDVSDDPPMVTPLKLLQRESKWVDCSFCKRMTKTKVQMVEQGEEPSGLMMCLVCLVCCPLLLCLPAMMGTTQSWTHTCSNCNAVVAIRGPQGIEVKEPPPSKLVPSKFGAANQGAAA